jgi:hypothetical protein
MSYLLTASAVAASYAELFDIANRDTLRKQINTVTADIKELEYRYSYLKSNIDRGLTPMYLGEVFRRSDVSDMLIELELTKEYLTNLKSNKQTNKQTNMKNKTNRQVLNNAIKELNEIEVAFMRTQLLTACDEVLDNEDEVRKQMANSIVSPELWINTMRNIKEKIEF